MCLRSITWTYSLQVIWKRLYDAASGMDGGTLYQLRNVINRRNITKNTTSNVTATEEYFLLVTEAHIVTAAMTLFQMDLLEDEPHSLCFPEGCAELPNSDRRTVFLHAARKLLTKFVDLSFCQQLPQPEDHVQAYACEVLSLGLLLMEFNDAIREGDGTRIIRCWRYFLFLFKANSRSNYAIESFTLLTQFDFLLPHRLARQLAWSRTVNTHGRPGKNISCDLHMEHLNREAKNQISGLGSNITDISVTRVGKSLGEVVLILQQFDHASGIKEPSSRHSKRSCEKDMTLLLKQLKDTTKVFSLVPGRAHRTFPKFQPNCMNSLTLPALMQWMEGQLHKVMTYSETCLM